MAPRSRRRTRSKRSFMNLFPLPFPLISFQSSVLSAFLIPVKHRHNLHLHSPYPHHSRLTWRAHVCPASRMRELTSRKAHRQRASRLCHVDRSTEAVVATGKGPCPQPLSFEGQHGHMLRVPDRPSLTGCQTGRPLSNPHHRTGRRGTSSAAPSDSCKPGAPPCAFRLSDTREPRERLQAY